MRNARGPCAPVRRLVFSLQPHLPHRPESRARDPRLMHEYLFASIVRYDEPESLGRVEPLHLRSRGAQRRFRSVPAPRRSPAIASLSRNRRPLPSAPPIAARRDDAPSRARSNRPPSPSRVRRASVHRRPSSSVLARVRHRASSTSIAPSRASRVVVSRVPRPPRRRRRASFLSASFARVARAPSRARASPSRAMARPHAAQSRRAGARVLCRARFGVRVVAS